MSLGKQKSLVHVLIPAGGSGLRFGTSTKKQFLKLKDDLILNHTLRFFCQRQDVAQIVVALPADEASMQTQLISHDKLKFVTGGETRSQSVYNAFAALAEAQPHDVVLIHDAVRPLLTDDLVERICTGVREQGAIVPVMPLTDTIKKLDADGQVVETCDRSQLFAAQTPQGFLVEVLQKAYDKIDHRDARFTDESLLVEAAGQKVFTVVGEKQNLKITTPHDLKIAGVFLERHCEER